VRPSSLDQVGNRVGGDLILGQQTLHRIENPLDGSSGSSAPWPAIAHRRIINGIEVRKGSGQRQ